MRIKVEVKKNKTKNIEHAYIYTIKSFLTNINFFSPENLVLYTVHFEKYHYTNLTKHNI